MKITNIQNPHLNCCDKVLSLTIPGGEAACCFLASALKPTNNYTKITLPIFFTHNKHYTSENNLGDYCRFVSVVPARAPSTCCVASCFCYWQAHRLDQ